MTSSLKAGGYGWGHAKKALVEAIVDGFAPQRRFNYLMANKSEIDTALKIGAKKARSVAADVLLRTREKAGY